LSSLRHLAKDIAGRRRTDPASLQKELGSGAADVARIVSEVRERLKIKLRPAKDPEEERYRLLQAVTGFLATREMFSRCCWCWKTCMMRIKARWTC
jgi:hypothetical protein